MTKKTTSSHEDARALLNSTRGAYIMGQALTLAARVLESGDVSEREPSNAADMRLLASLFLCLVDPSSYDGRIVGDNGDGND